MHQREENKETNKYKKETHQKMSKQITMTKQLPLMKQNQPRTLKPLLILLNGPNMATGIPDGRSINNFDTRPLVNSKNAIPGKDFILIIQRKKYQISKKQEYRQLKILIYN